MADTASNYQQRFYLGSKRNLNYFSPDNSGGTLQYARILDHANPDSVTLSGQKYC